MSTEKYFGIVHESDAQSKRMKLQSASIKKYATAHMMRYAAKRNRNRFRYYSVFCVLYILIIIENSYLQFFQSSVFCICIYLYVAIVNVYGIRYTHTYILTVHIYIHTYKETNNTT